MDYVAADNEGMKKDGTGIDVALVFCDPHGTYARHASAVMASIFANTKSRVCVYIIHDDTLTEENMSKLRQTADSFGQTVKFINVEKMFEEEVLDLSRLTNVGARGTLFRLLIPQLIDCPKIIYLDCDVIVNMDLREMWETDIGDSTAGAVRDVWSIDYLNGKDVSWRYALAWKAMGVEKDKYFNAGVLLMNLDKIRTCYDFINDVAAFNSRYKKAVTLADQDCLNHIFAGDVYFMDVKFNRIREEDIGDSGLVSIWHMAGAKPWECYTRPGVDELYWHYLAMTPYISCAGDMVTIMLQGLSSSQYIHKHSDDCIKKLKKQMADNIFRAHLWTVPYLYLILLTNKFSGKKNLTKQQRNVSAVS